MQKTTLSLHSRFQIAPVDPRIFGGFLEHIGRAVYQGVYEPDSPHADADGPDYESKSHGRANVIDAAAILAGGRLYVFITNRSGDQPAEVEIDLADGEIAAVESAEILTGPDARAANSFETPDTVAAAPFNEITLAPGRPTAKLPPLSVAAMTLTLAT